MRAWLSRGRTALVFVLLLALPAAVSAEPVKLTLLHVNDVYEISAKRGRGGLAELMTLLERERAAGPHHLTTLGGDLLSPSLLSGITQGRQMVELLNALGFDYAVLGNHEFDFGPQVLRQRMAESRFAWLATNTFDADGRPFGGAAASALREVAGLKVGLIGLLTPDTGHLSSPGPEVRFAPAAEAAAGAVAALKQQGADLVIALTHLSLAEDRALARSVKGIDVILGGHDHDPMTVYEGGVLILKAGYDAHYLAVAELSVDKRQTDRGPRVDVLPQWRYLSTAGVPAHAETAAIVARYEQRLDAELGQPVGQTAVELDSRRAAVRAGESTMGNLIADAIRAGVGADVGLTNGGGIRGDRTYDAGATLTRKDVLAELPFGNVTVLLELTGADLRAALEHGVSAVEDGAGRFPQVSGLAFAFDAAKAAGSRVLEVTVAGQPLDPARTYRIATNDYIAGGGDGYKVLTKARAVIDASGGTLMAGMVMDYIAAHSPVAAKLEGRIVRR